MFDTFRRHFDSLQGEAAVDLLENWLATTGKRVKGGLLSTAWREPRGATGASFVIGRLMLLEDVRPARPRHLYPSVRLDDVWVDRPELLAFVRSLLGEQPSSHVPELFHTPNAEHIYTVNSVDGQSGWAETQIKLNSRSNRVMAEWVPAVAPNLPPFQTWAEAATGWVFDRRATYGADVPFGGQLVLVLPDTRARACGLSAAERGITVHVDASGTPDEYELQYLFSRARERLEQGAVPFVATGQLEIPACPEATQLDVFCLNRQSGFVSHRFFYWEELRAAGMTVEVEDREFIDDLAGGERETVEFKPFASDSGKQREIVRTAVAFANTNGGRIYVGVDDAGAPEGRSGLKKFQSADDQIGFDTVAARLKKLIHDNVKPVPQAAYYVREIAGEPVCIAEIPAGTFVYSTHDNEILVRKGSTNRRPEAVELQALFAERQKGPSQARPDDDVVW